MNIDEQLHIELVELRRFKKNIIRRIEHIEIKHMIHQEFVNASYFADALKEIKYVAARTLADRLMPLMKEDVFYGYPEQIHTFSLDFLKNEPEGQ